MAGRCRRCPHRAATPKWRRPEGGPGGGRPAGRRARATVPAAAAGRRGPAAAAAAAAVPLPWWQGRPGQRRGGGGGGGCWRPGPRPGPRSPRPHPLFLRASAAVGPPRQGRREGGGPGGGGSASIAAGRDLRDWRRPAGAQVSVAGRGCRCCSHGAAVGETASTRPRVVPEGEP